MDTERWQRMERVLDRVLECDRSDWQRVLAEACGDDTDLRRDVEHLLRYDVNTREFQRIVPLADAVEEMHASLGGVRVGQTIGAHRIIQEIGRGGMSRVFLAERADGQYTQRVALKLLRTGVDTEFDHQRLRAERQILASLEHPNIARLLDGGVTDDGRPYLVLEYVDGVRIDQYCHHHALGVRQRLELFLTVASATQYAHRNLVVHRDLKPSNILVTASGQVKLLDFGIAKLLTHRADHVDTPRTSTGHRLMTPEYAAPEQILGGPITTGTDVYQLGALLYKLLALRVPFGERGSSVHELETAVLEREPAPPSSVCPPTAQRAIRGDLDAIILKALRKEPEERYASADDLAADVTAHLSGYPVLARRQTAGYRARRFARVHRWTLSAAAVITFLVSAYAVTVTLQSRRVRAALDEAEVERTRTEEVMAFTLGLFHADDPREAVRSGAVTRELLDRGLTRARALRGDPLTQARMLDVIGRVHTELGAYDDARRTLDEALTIRRRERGDAHADVAETLLNLGDVANLRGDHRAAFAHRQRAYEIRRGAFGATDRRTLSALYDAAASLHAGGNYEAARPLFDQWIAAVSSSPRETTPEHAQRLTEVAMVLSVRGDTVRAEALVREVLAIRHALYGDRHPDVANSMDDVATAAARNGKQEEAVRLLRDALAMTRAIYPEGHLDVTYRLHSLGATLLRMRRPDEAEPYILENLELKRRLLGPDHVSTGIANEELGHLNRQRNAFERAADLYREAHRIYSLHFSDPSNLMRLRAQIALGDALRGKGDLERAESLLVTGFERLPSRAGAASPIRRLALESLIALYEARSDESRAARYRTAMAEGMSARAK